MAYKSCDQPVLTRANYEIMLELLTGKYLRSSITNAKLEELTKKTGFGNYDPTIKKMETMGLIVGYVPVLSEKGRKMMDALKLMYGMSTSADEKDASLEELVEKIE